jgi:phosphocarrier protein HPr
VIQRTVPVGSTTGLHARPAAIFVKAAAALPVKVTASVEGKKPANAASMLAVLALGATQGTPVTLEADDDPDGQGRAAIEALADLLARNLDAEESEESQPAEAADG